MITEVLSRLPAWLRRNRGLAGLVALLEKHKSQLAILGIFLVLWLIGIVVNPGAFLGRYTYISLMSVIPITLTLALGFTLVVISKELDLSFPSVMGLSGWIFALLLPHGSIPAFFGAISTGLLAGILNGLIVTKVGVPSLVATLGMLFAWRGVIMVGTQGWGTSLTPYKETVIYDLLVGRIGELVPMQMLWGLLAVMALWLFLNRHKFGGYIYFVGDNPLSAKMMGINVDRVKIMAFALIGGMAALAGMIASLEVRSFWPSLGEGYLLPTIAAVFIGGTSPFGGTGTIFGTFMGALIIGSLETLILATGLTGFVTQLINGLIIVISVSAHVLLGGGRAKD